MTVVERRGGTARAFWVTAPGHGEIRAVDLPCPGPTEALVRTVRSGVSRGTESLVFTGRVPRSEHTRMRAPFQEGDLPGPVKYGYLNVGRVEEGPAGWQGRRVFCLHPHQTAYVVPVGSLAPVPEEGPVDRAVLAGTVETALNAVWDVAPLPGDRVTVVGAGMVGCCVARLVGRTPGVQVELVDTRPERAEVATRLGVTFATPERAAGERDVVVHTSASAAGLQLSLELLREEGEVLELSWYGDRPVELSLGGSFHARRLTIRASQVGAVARARRGRHSTAARLALALELLRDPAYDCLISGTSAFTDLPEVMARLASGELPALCHLVDYGADGAGEAVPCSA